MSFVMVFGASRKVSKLKGINSYYEIAIRYKGKCTSKVLPRTWLWNILVLHNARLALDTLRHTQAT